MEGSSSCSESTVTARSLGRGRGVPRPAGWLLLRGAVSEGLDAQASGPDAVTHLEDGSPCCGRGGGGVQKVLRGPRCGERPFTAWGGDTGCGGVQVSEDEGRTGRPQWCLGQGCLVGPCWVEGSGGSPACSVRQGVSPPGLAHPRVLQRPQILVAGVAGEGPRLSHVALSPWCLVRGSQGLGYEGSWGVRAVS